MEPDELEESLDVLGWSQRGLAAFIGADDRLVRRWVSGEKTVPPAVSAWLRVLVAAHKRNPPPAEWRRRAPALADAG